MLGLPLLLLLLSFVIVMSIKSGFYLLGHSSPAAMEEQLLGLGAL